MSGGMFRSYASWLSTEEEEMDKVYSLTSYAATKQNNNNQRYVKEFNTFYMMLQIIFHNIRNELNRAF